MLADLPPDNGRSPGTLHGCGVSIDLALFSASVGDRELRLTAREFDLLLLLLEESYRVTSREEIRRRIWKSSNAGVRVVDTYVCRLRKKLKQSGHPGVGVVQRRGYRLINPQEPGGGPQRNIVT